MGRNGEEKRREVEMTGRDGEEVWERRVKMSGKGMDVNIVWGGGGRYKKR